MTAIDYGRRMQAATRARRQTSSIARMGWDALMRLDATLAKAALHALGVALAGPEEAAQAKPVDRFDAAMLAVAFRQGLLGGATIERVTARGREIPFGEFATVQTHDLDVLYRPIAFRSISDVLEDDEAVTALRRNALVSGRTWRRAMRRGVRV